MKLTIQIFLVFAMMALVMSSCQRSSGDSPGSEFMPDMAHSIAYEANTYSYYYNNTWGSEDDYYQMAQPRKPVMGTIPRSKATTGGIKIPVNGSVPYYYGDSDEERTRASNEIIKNPLPITEKGLAVGKDLYTINCGICHGKKGDGAGYLVRDDGGKYPVQPANFLLDEFMVASNGRYYHSIIHGKNLMGSYSDKLSYEERWNVIHYIRSLQASEKKLVYNHLENTLNTIDVPGGEVIVMVEEDHSDEMHGHEEDHHSGHDDHGDDAGNHHDEDHHEDDHDGHDH